MRISAEFGEYRAQNIALSNASHHRCRGCCVQKASVGMTENWAAVQPAHPTDIMLLLLLVMIAATATLRPLICGAEKVASWAA